MKRRGEVGLVKGQGERAIRSKGQNPITLDRRAPGDPPNRGNIGRYARSVGAFSIEATYHKIALGNGVDLAIGALEGRHDQRTPAKAFRIGDGRNGDVQGLPSASEGRQISGDHHRRHVVELELRPLGHGDTELNQHVLQTLHGKGRLDRLIPRTGEAHHQSVAHELVISDPIDTRQILNQICGSFQRSTQAKQEQEDSKL